MYIYIYVNMHAYMCTKKCRYIGQSSYQYAFEVCLMHMSSASQASVGSSTAMQILQTLLLQYFNVAAKMRTMVNTPCEAQGPCSGGPANSL